MNIESIPKNNIADAVYKQMLNKILDGSWKENERLPSEFELSTMFNVSRTSTRSAVQKLRDRGIIYTKHGKGSFVSADIDKERISNSQKPIMHLSQEEFMDMMVFRQTVEFKCIELAAENANEEDIKAIEDALNRMLVNKNNYKKYSQADLDFHIAVIKASHNKIFIHIINDIKNVYYFYLEELNRVLGITLESIEAHIKVFMAIKEHDVDTAKTSLNDAMKNNIEAINKVVP
ncbi:FadR family transcriptional regulator [Limnobaculum zhutongyuii]|uniref:FadR family transcriptional regulator n=1 Tax=Limnobaculum zhutongyuii TaxID=2498113 RepID=A0A411WFN0_9GAMM|nr:FadR/GntR family transcriptional regulator [Limnobaculum zhutongyuii]QBH95035.1 FadR family transcriptional regulator [Limnobaculum zhutongyuii]TQS87625.1 FadR family transcriptional regulator [Limnobaculum zhutongyuii]